MSRFIDKWFAKQSAAITLRLSSEQDPANDKLYMLLLFNILPPNFLSTKFMAGFSGWPYGMRNKENA